jgi:AhpD family alkylhydroperoxidase
MARIAMPPGCRPGIQGLFELRPDIAAPMRALTETLLRGSSSLSRGERELVAAFVSTRNECRFSAGTHRAYAAALLEGGAELAAAVCRDYGMAPISEKLRVQPLHRRPRHVGPGDPAAYAAMAPHILEHGYLRPQT